MSYVTEHMHHDTYADVILKTLIIAKRTIVLIQRFEIIAIAMRIRAI